MRIVLAALLLAACVSDKAPFSDPALDTELTSDDVKADAVTNRTTIVGNVLAGVPVVGRFAVNRYVGYTFSGAAGETIDLALDAVDGESDPVLMLYGPRKANGKWPARLAMNDDAVGLDSRLLGVVLPADGVYLAVAGEYYKSAGDFELRLDSVASGPAIPECRAEGWVDPNSGELLLAADCADCNAYCGAIGSRSEGWYSTCGGLIDWAGCAASTETCEAAGGVCSADGVCGDGRSPQDVPALGCPAAATCCFPTCRALVPPAPSFCPDGTIVPRHDAWGACITGYDCI